MIFRRPKIVKEINQTRNIALITEGRMFFASRKKLIKTGTRDSWLVARKWIPAFTGMTIKNKIILGVLCALCGKKRKEKVMATENQVNANRKNALKSTGPRTEEGKNASSQNATKHGLRAKRDVIKTENQDEFDIYRTKMLDDLSPDGAMEEMLAERIVSLSWRLKRAEHFQNAVVDALIEHGLNGFSSGFGWTSENRERAQKEAADGEMDVLLGIVINHDFANAKTLEQLLIYEHRIESSLYRTISELKKARKFKKTEFRDSGLAARDSFYKDELQTSEICSCKNKPNSEETAWAEVHPTSYCTNEANFMEEKRTKDTEDKIFQDLQENENCTIEANLEEQAGREDKKLRRLED